MFERKQAQIAALRRALEGHRNGQWLKRPEASIHEFGEWVAGIVGGRWCGAFWRRWRRKRSTAGTSRSRSGRWRVWRTPGAAGFRRTSCIGNCRALARGLGEVGAGSAGDAGTGGANSWRDAGGDRALGCAHEFGPCFVNCCAVRRRDGGGGRGAGGALRVVAPVEQGHQSDCDWHIGRGGRPALLRGVVSVFAAAGECCKCRRMSAQAPASPGFRWRWSGRRAW